MSITYPTKERKWLNSTDETIVQDNYQATDSDYRSSLIKADWIEKFRESINYLSHRKKLALVVQQELDDDIVVDPGVIIKCNEFLRDFHSIEFIPPNLKIVGSFDCGLKFIWRESDLKCTVHFTSDDHLTVRAVIEKDNEHEDFFRIRDAFEIAYKWNNKLVSM